MRISVSILENSNANVSSWVGEKEQIGSDWRLMHVRQQKWTGWTEKWEEEKGSYSRWKKHEKDKGMSDKIYRKHWRHPRLHGQADCYKASLQAAILWKERYKPVTAH